MNHSSFHGRPLMSREEEEGFRISDHRDPTFWFGAASGSPDAPDCTVQQTPPAPTTLFPRKPNRTWFSFFARLRTSRIRHTKPSSCRGPVLQMALHTQSIFLLD